eukprot:11197114-Lingulodinium_polyedra.AAC.1
MNDAHGSMRETMIGRAHRVVTVHVWVSAWRSAAVNRCIRAAMNCDTMGEAAHMFEASGKMD